MKDLFDDYEAYTDNVKSVLESYDENADGYAECARIIGELNKIGYTADYDLSAQLYDLTQLYDLKQKQFKQS